MAALWFRMPEYSAYVNDSWNVSQKLSVTRVCAMTRCSAGSSLDNYWGVMEPDLPRNRLATPGLTPGTHTLPIQLTRTILRLASDSPIAWATKP